MTGQFWDVDAKKKEKARKAKEKAEKTGWKLLGRDDLSKMEGKWFYYRTRRGRVVRLGRARTTPQTIKYGYVQFHDIHNNYQMAMACEDGFIFGPVIEPPAFK
jgi:hypothetical protein